MKVLRTPEEPFQNLPGYDFAPHYVDIDGLRMHYLDEGPKDGAAVLLLHGEPTWSYLYRKMIPPLVEAGFRVFAPDLIGFGKSDKPTRVEDYSYQAHMDWLAAWLDQLQLQNLSLFCQDWGSLLGLRMAAEHPSDLPAFLWPMVFYPPAISLHRASSNSGKPLPYIPPCFRWGAL